MDALSQPPPNTIIRDATGTTPPHGPRRNHRPGRRRIHRARNLLTPAAMAKSLGSPLLLAAVWCGMGAFALCGAFCYSELAVRYPQAGGEYVYLRNGYGPASPFSMDGCRPRPRSRTRRCTGCRRGALRPIAAAGVRRHSLLGFRQSSCSPSPSSTTPELALSGRIMAGAICQDRGAFRPRRMGLCLRPCHHRQPVPLAHRRAGSEAIFPAIAGATMNAFFSFGGWWEAGKIAGEVRNPGATCRSPSPVESCL